MSKKEKQIRDLMEQTLERLKQAGADHATVGYSTNTSTEIAVMNGQVTTVEIIPEAARLSMEVYVGEKSESFEPDTKRPDLLAEAARAVVKAARSKEDNPTQMPAPLELIPATLNNKSLDVFDPCIPTKQELIEGALAAEAAARSVPGVSKPDTCQASWSRSLSLTLTSQGVFAINRETGNVLYTAVIAESENGMENGYGYSSAIYRSDVKDPHMIGRIASERAVSALNPKPIPTSGRLPVVFDRGAAAELLGTFASAASGGAMFLKQSFLMGKVGEQVLAKGLTIKTNPHKRRSSASSLFTGEFLPTRPTIIVKDGVLLTPFLNLESARRLGYDLRAIHGRAANMTLEPGVRDAVSLIADIKDGLYVTGMMGHGTNIATGDFSRGVTGFWIKNGAITHPVTSATIAGNLAEMFLNMTPANDLDRDRGSVAAPTLRIETMTIA